MEALQQYHTEAAVLLARLFLGGLFLFQGYDVLFRVRVHKVVSAYRENFREKGIPGFMSVAGIWYTSLTEFICGMLLIAGLFQYAALYLLGINLLVASVAFAVDTPLWNMRHVFPRLALLLFLLLVPPVYNTWTIDHLLFNL